MKIRDLYQLHNSGKNELELKLDTQPKARNVTTKEFVILLQPIFLRGFSKVFRAAILWHLWSGALKMRLRHAENTEAFPKS